MARTMIYKKYAKN